MRREVKLLHWVQGHFLAKKNFPGSNVTRMIRTNNVNMKLQWRLNL